MTGPSYEPNQGPQSLDELQELVDRIESSLGRGRPDAELAMADDLVSITQQLLAAIDQNPARDLEAEAELVAALRVYRNAAFALRRLASGAQEADPSLVEISRNLINQGHDHLRLYRNIGGASPQ
ncbi:MAG: hypothetical protein ACRD6W_04770 [Nitrososphaerales archaeon]